MRSAMLQRLLLLICAAYGGLAFPNGAPIEACLRGMSPNHTPHVSQDPRTIPFAVYRETFEGGVRVTIQSTGERYFKGFMIQAQLPTAESRPAVGSWQPVDHVNQLPECAAVTHADRSEKAGVTVTWNGCENVVIKVTVLENYSTFWSDLEVPEARGSSGGGSREQFPSRFRRRNQRQSAACQSSFPAQQPFNRRGTPF